MTTGNVARPDSAAAQLYESGAGGSRQSTNLGDILERVLDKGIVIAGDIQVNLLDIELLTIKLRLIVASLDTAREVGINWWEDDPWLNADAARRELRATERGEGNGHGLASLGGQSLAAENQRLRDRVRVLESAEADRRGIPAASEGTAIRTMAAERGIWVYAVAECGAGAMLPGIPGVAGAEVRLAAAADLTAVVSDVDLAEFGPAALQRNLEDLAWLETVARAHHGVIEAAARLFSLLPMRLATVYTSEATTAAGLQGHAAGLEAALRRLRGRTEWGVKAYAAQPPRAHGRRTPSSAGTRPTAACTPRSPRSSAGGPRPWS